MGSKIVEKRKNQSETVSEYVKNTRTALTVDIIKAKHKVNAMNSLVALSDSEKLDYLFGLIDKNDSGGIDVAELSDVLRKANPSLSFKDGVDNALKGIAANDDNDDLVLGRDEFGHYIEK